MEFLIEALKALPSIATSPLAFIGYLFTLLAWVFAINRSARLKELLAKLQDVSPRDRARIIQLELGEVLPSKISAEQWIRARNNRYYLVAFIALLITVLTIGSVAIVEGSDRAQQAEQHRVEEEKRRQRQQALQEKRRTLKLRLQQIEKQLEIAKSEYERGAAAVILAPRDQKPIGIEIMNTAQKEIERLEKEKKKIQEQIDELPIE